MLRLLLFLLLFLLSGAPAQAAPDPDAAILAGKASLPGLRLTLRTDKARYEQGEPIPITLRYTYSGVRPLTVMVVTGDRSGRIMDFSFGATDAAGKAVPDPTPFRGGMGGGARSDSRLTPSHPYEQTVTLNEWLRFDAPGRYTVMAQSSIIHLNGDDSMGLDGPIIPLTSEPFTVEITPPDDGHRQTRLARDEKDEASRDPETRLHALRDLRFLVDARAIPLLVRGLDDDYTNAVYEAWFGLRTFPDSALVKAALLRVIADPSHLILPARQWSYRNLLSEVDQRLTGKPPTPEQGKQYQALFDQGLRRALAAAPVGRAAELTVEGMAIGVLSHTDPANWRRVLDNAARMSAESQQYAGSSMEIAVEMPKSFPDLAAFRSLQPELRRVRADPRLDPALRSGAILMLHALGDDTFRDHLAADVVAAKPVFTDAAHRTLGSYHASEIGESLLALVASPDDDIRASASERLRDFGAAVPAARLRALMVREEARDDYAARDAVLEALALKSPAEALPFLTRQIAKPNRPYGGESDIPIRLVCRLPSPEARRIVHRLFASPRPEMRETVAQALGASWRGAREPTGEQGRRLPPDASLAASYVPALLALVQNDPDGSVRAAARQALNDITGLPKNGAYSATDAQKQAWIPLWQEWWRQNQARYQAP